MANNKLPSVIVLWDLEDCFPSNLDASDAVAAVQRLAISHGNIRKMKGFWNPDRNENTTTREIQTFSNNQEYRNALQLRGVDLAACGFLDGENVVKAMLVEMAIDIIDLWFSSPPSIIIISKDLSLGYLGRLLQNRMFTVVLLESWDLVQAPGSSFHQLGSTSPSVSGSNATGSFTTAPSQLSSPILGNAIPTGLSSPPSPVQSHQYLPESPPPTRYNQQFECQNSRYPPSSSSSTSTLTTNKPSGAHNGAGAVNQDSPELVDRQVKAFPNKLTMGKSNYIFGQIITRANKSEQERKEEEEAERLRKIKEDEEKAAAEAEAERTALEARKKAKAAEATLPSEEGKVVGASTTATPPQGGSKKVKESLRSDTATSNTANLGRKRPGPLDLSAAKTINQSSHSTARYIEDLNSVKYPEGIRGPRKELNENAKPGHFRYDRDFLLQFMSVCNEKPPNLPPLGAIGLDQASLMMTRGGSARHRKTPMSGPSRHSISSFGGPSGLRKGEETVLPGMGNFTTGGRFPGQSYQQQDTQTMSLEPVVPLQSAADLWDRKVLGIVDQDSPEHVDKQVKALLNKLTMDEFDSISDQIITWANKSEQEKDGRTLAQVVRLVFEQATDEANSEMYARLCRKMMERTSPKVQDHGITNTEGKPIAGGQLFRKYLLNRCQEDFECGWVAKEATALAAASKAANQGKEEGSEGVVLYSEEYYAAQKAKRQGLGLIKFIGELFKLQMLTERIMHEYVKKLLGNVENQEEEEIESLCKLLTTVGALLDTQKARAHMDIYFSRMKELTKSPNVNSRMQFILQDLFELRERKWIPRIAAATTTNLARVHENAAKEKAAGEKESFQRQSGMSRMSSDRGRNDMEQQGFEGWAVAAVPRPPPKAGDITNFGKIIKSPQAMLFGPTAVFSKKDSKREQPISLSASNSNMFTMLQQADANTAGKSEPTQRRKLVLQPRIVLHKEDGAATTSASRAGSDIDSDEEDTSAAAPELSDADAKKKIDEDIKELFAVRDLDEAEVYFPSLPSKHHSALIDKLVSKAVESKPADAELVASFFERASSKELCSASAFESGFEPTAEFIYDIALDAPRAPNLFAQIVKGAGLSKQARQQVASKSPNSDSLLALLS